MPMQVYAAGFDQSSRRPRVGLVLAGIGLNAALSEQAIRSLPGGVTLAVSPYAEDPERLLTEARDGRARISAVDPDGAARAIPLNDPGDHALTTRATPEQNPQQLVWALSRFAGYVGATGALGLTRGERFAAVPDDLDPVLATLARRGLLYVDPRPRQRNRELRLPHGLEPAGGPGDRRTGRCAPRSRRNWRALDRIARDKGSASGLAGAVRPVTIERIAAWANELAANGLALAPVSALVQAPPANTAETAQ